MNSSYKTAEIGLAAFLRIHGYKIPEVTRIDRNRCMFWFEPDAEEKADAYWNSDCAQMMQAVRELKARTDGV